MICDRRLAMSLSSGDSLNGPRSTQYIEPQLLPRTDPGIAALNAQKYVCVKAASGGAAQVRFSVRVPRARVGPHLLHTCNTHTRHVHSWYQEACSIAGLTLGVGCRGHRFCRREYGGSYGMMTYRHTSCTKPFPSQTPDSSFGPMEIIFAQHAVP